jgi:hypothetical protein
MVYGDSSVLRKLTVVGAVVDNAWTGKSKERGGRVMQVAPIEGKG